MIWRFMARLVFGLAAEALCERVRPSKWYGSLAAYVSGADGKIRVERGGPLVRRYPWTSVDPARRKKEGRVDEGSSS